MKFVPLILWKCKNILVCFITCVYIQTHGETCHTLFLFSSAIWNNQAYISFSRFLISMNNSIFLNKIMYLSFETNMKYSKTYYSSRIDKNLLKGLLKIWIFRKSYLLQTTLTDSFQIYRHSKFSLVNQSNVYINEYNVQRRQIGQQIKN